jgi:hypothetical protein
VSRGKGETLTVPKPRAVGLLAVCLAVKPVGEPEIGTSGSMSGGWETERWLGPKQPRPSSTLPTLPSPAICLARKLSGVSRCPRRWSTTGESDLRGPRRDIATSRMRRSVPSARILPLVASFLFIVRLGAGKGGRLQPHASEKALGGKNDVLY